MSSIDFKPLILHVCVVATAKLNFVDALNRANGVRQSTQWEAGRETIEDNDRDQGLFPIACPFCAAFETRRDRSSGSPWSRVSAYFYRGIWMGGTVLAMCCRCVNQK